MLRSSQRLSVYFATCALLLPAVGITADAADHFLVVGGGDSPTNNQVSLEKDVIFFQRLLVDRQAPAADVLFGDGDSNARDLQFIPSAQTPRLNVLLSELFGGEQDVAFHYRRHQLSGVRGASNRKGLDEWFNSVGKNLADGDRLFIYFTGHGGSGAPPRNTTMSMWCEPPMHVLEFSGLLDRLSPKLQVVMFMVQCHSGGFASTLFKDGKVGGALSPARRCGFFATTYDRNAAGCTPDTVEDDYEDYSTYFFAALDGKTRTGKLLDFTADFDGDGHVSFAEAHAYAVLHSDTIDIPNTTSDALLRQFSKTSGKELVHPQAPYAQLMSRATSLQRIVADGLCKQLKLTTENRYDEARRLADLVEAERRSVEKERGQKSGEADQIGNRIRRRLEQRWPELGNPWHPDLPEVLKREGPEIVQAIEGDTDYAQWTLHGHDIDRLFDRSLDLERRWVKCQRLERQLETIALAANLEQVAAPEIVARYKELVQDEAGIFETKVASASVAK